MEETGLEGLDERRPAGESGDLSSALFPGPTALVPTLHFYSHRSGRFWPLWRVVRVLPLAASLPRIHPRSFPAFPCLHCMARLACDWLSAAGHCWSRLPASRFPWMSQWLACLSESPTCIFPPNRPASPSPVLCTRAHMTLPTSSFPGQRGLGRDDYATHLPSRPTESCWDRVTSVHTIFQLGFFVGRDRLSPVVSLLGCWERGRTSRYLLAASLIYCYFRPRYSHERVPSLHLPLPRSLRFLIPLSGGKSLCASLRLPPFHDLRILLTLQPYHTAGRYIAGEARSEKRPTTAPALPAAAPTLFPAGVIFAPHTLPLATPPRPSWPFRVSIDN